MKKIIFLSWFLPLFVFSSNEIGFVKEMAGNATLNQKKLKKNDKISENDKLIIAPGSKVILQFSDGSIKILKSQTVTITSKNSRLYQKIQKNADKAMEVIGVKGNYLNDKKKKTIDEIKESFGVGDYTQVIDLIESHKMVFDQVDLLFIAAFSYLKTGLSYQSIPLFEKIILYQTYNYQEIAYYSLALAFMDTGQSKKYQEVLKKFEKEFPDSNLLLSLKNPGNWNLEEGK